MSIVSDKMESQQQITASLVLAMTKDELVRLATKHNIQLDEASDKISMQVLILDSLGLIVQSSKSSTDPTGTNNNTFTNNTNVNVGSGLPDFSQITPTGPSTSFRYPSVHVLSEEQQFKARLPGLIPLLPVFVENNIDNFFGMFERVANSLGWSRRFWTLFFPHCLKGKAVSVFLSLSEEQIRDYDLTKNVILSAYQRSSEYYRQKFRNQARSANQTVVEFQRQKEELFQHWIQREKVTTFNSLKDLILKENLNFFLTANERQIQGNNPQCSALEMAANLDNMSLVVPMSNNRPTYQPGRTQPSASTQSGNHSAQSYPQQGNSGRGYEDKSRNTNTNRPRYFCTYCNAPGHSFEYCRNKNGPK